MRSFPKPVIYISKCLGFDGCRFNGQILPNDFIDMLSSHVNLAVICPEFEIGLGIPRNPIRLVQEKDGTQKLLQYETERDVTGEMNQYTDSLTESISDVDGFILKSRSPTCGFADVKTYPGLGKVSPSGKSEGLFAGEIVRRFPDAACEDEGRLTNFVIREHFLTRIFASAHWRELEKTGTMAALVKFHSDYKYLLMGYEEAGLRELGPVVANHEKKPIDEVFTAYGSRFHRALASVPQRKAMINTLYHVFGHISDGLKKQEKTFAINSIEMYREERVPLSVPLHLLYSHAIGQDDHYITSQILFQPFPLDLVLISDSGQGRKIK